VADQGMEGLGLAPELKCDIFDLLLAHQESLPEKGLEQIPIQTFLSD
jgi:hypothetical protein